MTTASRTELRLEVEDFLYHEARLLDERRFHEWLDLFTEDLVYWMPIRSNRLRKDMANEIAQPDHLAYFNDDLTMLKGRVARLDTDMAWAEDPPSRTQHMVYNVQIDAVEGDEIQVHCSFILYRNRSRGARPAIVEAYIEATRAEVAQHLSYDQAYRVAPVHSTVFPNFSFLNNGTMRVWHPKGPEKMEVWAWVAVEKDAPPEVKRAMLRNAQYNFSVSGIFEQDDGENWSQCSASNRGYIGRQQDFNYQMGLGHEERMEEFPGRRGFAFSEINQRGFYKRWREMMLLDTWDELRPGLRSSGDQ